MIKVLHISTNDIVGGAAIAAYRLHKGLLSKGFDSIMFTAQKKSVDPSVLVYKPNSSLCLRLKSTARGNRVKYDYWKYKKLRPAGADMFSDDRTRHGPEIVSQLPVCDIINLHWISGFIDYRSFFGSRRQLPPVVWTLHDMNAFTGGCHYNFGCDKYIHGCAACPQLGSEDFNDLSRRIWTRKKKVFGQLNQNSIHFIAPSKWLARRAQESRLLRRFEISTIPYGLNAEDFAPRDRHHARRTLGIPSDARAIVFVAQSIQNNRKGFEYLRKALSDGDKIENLFIITIGKTNSPLNLNVPFLQIGYLENNRLLSLVYSSADIFVIPSVQDNFPNTILESLACGTPVVGFDSSGISEMIQSSKTGILAPVRDIGNLRAAIADLLNSEQKRNEMSVNCRQTFLKHYALGFQASQYERLYESIIRGKC